MTEPTRRGRRTAGDDVQLGSVTIGAREIYDVAMGTDRKVQRLVDNAEQTADTLRDHEGRITGLEARRWPLGVGATVLSAIGLLVSLAAYFHH